MTFIKLFNVNSINIQNLTSNVALQNKCNVNIESIQHHPKNEFYNIFNLLCLLFFLTIQFKPIKNNIPAKFSWFGLSNWIGSSDSKSDRKIWHRFNEDPIILTKIGFWLKPNFNETTFFNQFLIKLVGFLFWLNQTVFD